MNLETDIATLASLVPGDAVDADHVTVVSPTDGRVAHSAFDVDRLLAASAAYATAAIDGLDTGNGRCERGRRIDLRHLMAYCTTHVEVDGDAVPAWADLSGLYETADGRSIQLHCNFAHHGEGVVRRLGCEPDRDSVAGAIRTWNSFELEQVLVDDGMIAAVVRSLDEWDRHPHAAATTSLPVVSVEQVDRDRPAPPRSPASDRDPSRPGTPAAGLRVLDCSRVLAGPVAGQLLAGGGADVLRIGADHLPSVPLTVMATGFGKRTASVDVSRPDGVDRFDSLLGDADVWIDAYRPGAFADRGLTPEHVAWRRPGAVVVQISAFDWVGPWAGRRGYDSIVQSTTGIRWAGGEFGRGAAGPTGLPVQALDYATGFLAAGVAAQLVAHQRTNGGTWLARLSLLRTRNWLTGLGGPWSFTPGSVPIDRDLLDTVDSEFGALTTVRPFVGESRWPPRPLGSDQPIWST